MIGQARFEFYLSKLEQLIKAAGKTKDPATYLFTNDARTTLFMLEALSKMYSELHDGAIFRKLKEKFKDLEDMLGDIDNYEALHTSYKDHSDSSIPAFFMQQKNNAIKSLNELLKEKKWTGKGTRIEKIRDKLKEVEWLDEEDELKAIQTFYRNSIVEINVFYNSVGKPFADMEDHVHELRRKLRWLSIYPQAMGGSIQLTTPDDKTDHLDKYLTPEVINSPYNKLAPATGKYFLLLDQKRFLALSWMISELGKLKDKGLNELALHEAEKKPPAGSEKKDNATVSGFLEQATAISAPFFEEHNLEQMLVGVSTDRSAIVS